MPAAEIHRGVEDSDAGDRRTVCGWWTLGEHRREWLPRCHHPSAHVSLVITVFACLSPSCPVALSVPLHCLRLLRFFLRPLRWALMFLCAPSIFSSSVATGRVYGDPVVGKWCGATVLTWVCSSRRFWYFLVWWCVLATTIGRYQGLSAMLQKIRDLRLWRSRRALEPTRAELTSK